jgi:hypothetical protein
MEIQCLASISARMCAVLLVWTYPGLWSYVGGFGGILKDTAEFEQSSNERKKVEMRFAHLKVHYRFERMRLRGLSGARDEFHLAASAQNLKTLANHIWRPRPDARATCAA